MLTRLRRACRRLGIARLDGGPAGIAATFRGQPPAVEGLGRHDNRLLLRQPSRTAAERLTAAAALLRALPRREPPLTAAARSATTRRRGRRLPLR